MENLFTDFWFLVFATVTITSVVSTIAGRWKEVRLAEIDGALKQEMLQRGMSAGEIQQVIDAGRKRSAKNAAASATSEPVKTPAPAQ